MYHRIIYIIVIAVLQSSCFNTKTTEEKPVPVLDSIHKVNATYPKEWKTQVRDERALPFEMGINCSQVFHISHDEEIHFFIPGDYPPNLYCIIMLRGPSMHRLVLTLRNISYDGNSLSNTTDCAMDAIHIYSASRGIIKYKDQLCNGNIPAIVTEENVGLLTFNSAGSLVNNGFTVEVQILQSYAANTNRNNYYHNYHSPYDCETQSWLVGYHYTPKWTSQNDLTTWLKNEHSNPWSQAVPIIHNKHQNIHNLQTEWENVPRYQEKWHDIPEINNRWPYATNSDKKWENTVNTEGKWYKIHEEGKWYK